MLDRLERNISNHVDGAVRRVTWRVLSGVAVIMALLVLLQAMAVAATS